MIIYPQYQDVITSRKLQSGHLPFYIGIHSAEHTPLHYHDFVEFTYVIEGQGTESINGKKHQLLPGAASFLLPHHMHEVLGQPGTPVRKYCCMFNINMVFDSDYDMELNNLVFKIGSELPSFAHFESTLAAKMQGIFEDLHHEYEHKSGAVQISLIRAKLIEALCLFVRAISDNQQATMPEPQQDSLVEVKDESGARQNFLPLLEYVHQHFLEKLTLEELARKFGVSVPYISRYFKKNIGKGFLEYLHELRVERAAGMLKSTNMSVIDISVETGFESYRTFSRVFRDLKGQTPTEYRKSKTK